MGPRTNFLTLHVCCWVYHLVVISLIYNNCGIANPLTWVAPNCAFVHVHGVLCLWPHTRQATRLMAFVHELCLWSHMRQVLLWWGVPTRCICDVIPQLWNHQTAYLGGAKCRQTAAHTVCCSRCFACAWAGALFTPCGTIYQAHAKQGGVKLLI